MKSQYMTQTLAYVGRNTRRVPLSRSRPLVKTYLGQIVPAVLGSSGSQGSYVPLWDPLSRKSNYGLLCFDGCAVEFVRHSLEWFTPLEDMRAVRISDNVLYHVGKVFDLSGLELVTVQSEVERLRVTRGLREGVFIYVL